MDRRIDKLVQLYERNCEAVYQEQLNRHQEFEDLVDLEIAVMRTELASEKGALQFVVDHISDPSEVLEGIIRNFAIFSSSTVETQKKFQHIGEYVFLAISNLIEPVAKDRVHKSQRDSIRFIQGGNGV